MKERLMLDGIITAMNIPFDDNNNIDTEGIYNQVNSGIEAGVVGFMVPVFASEVHQLSLEERQMVVKTVIAAAEDRVPVIGGTTANSKGESLLLANDFIRLGCKGILCAVPYENDEQYAEDVSDLAALEPDFLMIQDWSTGGYGVPVDIVTQIFYDIPRFRCFKIEVVPAGPKYTEILERTDGRMHISGGWACSQMIEALDRGVHAFAVTAMSEVYCKIIGLYRQGRRDDASALFKKLLPAIAFSTQHLDISICFYKRLMWRQGLYKTPNVRHTTYAFDAYHIRVADELIDEVIGLTYEVKSGQYY